jgi:hypothetical protein
MAPISSKGAWRVEIRLTKRLVTQCVTDKSTSIATFLSVGIDEETGEHLIEVIITWVAWYGIYFRLLAAEV